MACWPSTRRTRRSFLTLPHLLVTTFVFGLAFRAPAPPRAPARPGPLLRIGLDRTNRGPFLRGVVWMAPFVFAFPGIAFATLPALAGGKIQPSYVGALAALTLAAGMAAQPFTRRIAPTAAARAGLLVGAAGVLLGAGAVVWHATLPLLAAAALLGVGYGVCMTSGLRLVEALSRPETRAGLAGLYYVLTYAGFTTPLLARAGRAPDDTDRDPARCRRARAVRRGRAAGAARRSPEQPLTRTSRRQQVGLLCDAHGGNGGRWMTQNADRKRVADMIPSRRFVLIALAFICASVMTVTFFGVAQTRMLEARARDIVDDMLTSIRLVRQLDDYVEEKHLLVDDHILASLPAEMARIEARLTAIDAAIATTLRAYEPWVNQPGERATSEQTRAHLLTLKEPIDRALALSRENRDAEAQHELELVSGQFALLNDDFDRLVAINDQGATASLVALFGDAVPPDARAARHRPRRAGRRRERGWLGLAPGRPS